MTDPLSTRIARLLPTLEHLKVETGSLACLGCGHEHNCSTHGCAILRETVDILESTIRRAPKELPKWKDSGPWLVCPACDHSVSDPYELGDGRYCPQCGQPLQQIYGEETHNV